MADPTLAAASPQPDPIIDSELEDLRLLLDTIHERSGLDFRQYALSSLRRRIARVIKETDADSIAGLHQRLRADDRVLGEIIPRLTVHTSAMFRDPDFFRSLRTQVVPVLRTYPFIRIWIAGCSTGEEVYTLSILLHEEGIADRCRIYATDLSDNVLARARDGVFPLAAMQDYSRNYQLAGGRASLADYFTADSEWVVFRRSLRNSVVFGVHNLVSDASFNEFHLILCRNVLIYFRRELQDKVHGLFHSSLGQFGYLGLGRSEAVRFSSYHDCYEAIDARERVFRKIR